MTGPTHQAQAASAAGRLIVAAAWPLAALAVVALALSLSPPATFGTAATLAGIGLVIAGTATILLSALVLFDALLFRLIASHEDTEDGLAAVDDILARMRLKPRPERLRGLSERIAGTRRLVLRQQAAALLALATALGLYLAGRAP